MPLIGNPMVEWLLTAGWDIEDSRQLVGALCRRMLQCGIPLMRLRLTLRTLHPQFLGATYTWTRRDDHVAEFLPEHEILQTDAYLKSPYAVLFEGAGAVRRRLDREDAELEFPILADLKAEGGTDYVAMRLTTSDGRNHAITLATDRPGGFTAIELAIVDQMVPILARLVEIHATRRTTRTILDTYLGKGSGKRVMEGAIKRGDGETIHAVIWFSDLRSSTALAERLPRQQFLDLLNDYFEGVAGTVIEHGGEVLRFIGDAALAIFPIGGVTDKPWECPEHVHACETALNAARMAEERIAACNSDRASRSEALIRFGIGLHLGDVLYGNIGTPSRLEFSVIGSAANEAARLEGMCKRLETSIVVSETFARVLDARGLRSVGFHALKGVSDPLELFTVEA